VGVTDASKLRWAAVPYSCCENEVPEMTDKPLEPEPTDLAAVGDPAADDPAVNRSGSDPAHHRGPSGDWASRPNADAHPEGVAVDSAHWTPGHEGDRSTGAISSADWVGGHEGAVPSRWAEGSEAKADDDTEPSG